MSPIADKRTQFAICAMLFGFVLVATPALHGYYADMNLWRDWAWYNTEYGLRNAYASGTDYTPLYQYVLWLFGKMAGTQEAIRHYIGYIRIFTLAAELWGLYIVYRWMGMKVDYTVLLLLSMFNIAYSYNTIIWCQVDAILAALACAALYYLYRGRMIVSGIMLILMLNMKLQGIVLVPLWGLLVIEYMARTRRWRAIPLTLLAMAAVQAAILVPFAFGDGGLAQVWKKISGLVDAIPTISSNAYNMWYWIVPDAGSGKPDNVPFIDSLTYKNAGLILFCTGSLLAFIPLLSVTIKQIFRKKELGIPPAPSPVLIWLTAAQIVLLFFFCNTQMHERYSHPAFIFLTAYAFYTRRFGLYIIFSLAYFLNLEHVLRWFEMPYYDTVLFHAGVIALLFAIVIAGLYYRLYQVLLLRNYAVAGSAEKSQEAIHPAALPGTPGTT